MQAKVLNALDLRKIKDIVLLETDATRTSFVIVPITEDDSKSHPVSAAMAPRASAVSDVVTLLNSPPLPPPGACEQSLD